MKLQINDLYNLQEGLSNLINEKLPVATAFKVQKNYKLVMTELESVDEVRKKIVEEHQKDKSKGQDEFVKLMKQETDVDLKHITLSDFNIDVTPKTLALIEIIIEEENE